MNKSYQVIRILQYLVKFLSIITHPYLHLNLDTSWLITSHLFLLFVNCSLLTMCRALFWHELSAFISRDKSSTEEGKKYYTYIMLNRSTYHLTCWWLLCRFYPTFFPQVYLIADYYRTVYINFLKFYQILKNILVGCFITCETSKNRFFLVTITNLASNFQHVILNISKGLKFIMQLFGTCWKKI